MRDRDRSTFFNYLLLLWIITLVALAVVADVTRKEIKEQREVGMEKRKEPKNR